MSLVEFLLSIGLVDSRCKWDKHPDAPCPFYYEDAPEDKRIRWCDCWRVGLDGNCEGDNFKCPTTSA